MMVARARHYEENGDEYAYAQRVEAKVLKHRLKGKWVWKTFYPIDSMDNLPKNAVVLERSEETGVMVVTKKFDPRNKQHFIKFPPYRATPESKRLTFSQQRKLIDESISYDLDEDHPINDDTGAER